MKTGIKKWVKITAAVITVILLLFTAFFVYALDYSRPEKVALDALSDTDSVDVRMENNMIVFSPAGTESDTGFAFYPGGKVDYRAYAPLMADLAERGVTCVLLKMPFQLAVFDINAADRALSTVPRITRWYVGGHSLGGVMASSYAASHTERIEGIVFLAAYPSGDMKNTGLRVLSLYGTEDGVLDMKSFTEAKNRNPGDTVYLEIPGGNHAGFGSYGTQKGDHPALISSAEQCGITADKILLFLEGEEPSSAAGVLK